MNEIKRSQKAFAMKSFLSFLYVKGDDNQLKGIIKG
jgi:hypothetical protein